MSPASPRCQLFARRALVWLVLALAWAGGCSRPHPRDTPPTPRKDDEDMRQLRAAIRTELQPADSLRSLPRRA